MKIIYVGGFDAVDVPYEEDGTPKLLTARAGEPVECPDELAAMLLEQTDNWRTAESTAARGRKTEATTPAG